MSTHDTRPPHVGRQDAIDVNDFVYAATGARVRRLTMPDGTHWFPAADLCRQLKHTNTSEALRRHVPEHMRCIAGSLISREGWSIPAGQGLRKSMVLVSLNGLVRLVNGCVKAECEPFKNWITDVVVTVQRDGSYSLDEAETQVRTPGAPKAYAMPDQVADVIIRMEQRNLQLDEEYAVLRREELRMFGRIADSLDRIADKLGAEEQVREERPAFTPADRAHRAPCARLAADAAQTGVHPPGRGGRRWGAEVYVAPLIRSGTYGTGPKPQSELAASGPVAVAR
ncbi:Bro-N domain-containing protein [Streptomyces paromomycinus]|uniref:DNA-binding protein n=1 Tax=Streptomyces paromomycinus TaxID=92743 RepID=A0A401W4U0_STREY|nr:Bro-N domain-containing protein [Streptomyces paromomycinus]GCD44354.1 DNA-binding protein [Streptomyces paromomycinus]